MGKISLYEHRVSYYETDQMGIVHHSNYIRWFEDARVDFLEKVGFSYAKMEEYLSLSTLYLKLTFLKTIDPSSTSVIAFLGESIVLVS